MSSECIVLDEWLIHDLLGENTRDAQDKAHRFLTAIRQKCDHIAVITGSNWMKKAYGLMRESSPLLRKLSKQLHLDILLDPDKCILLGDQNVKPLSTDLRELVSEDKAYLVATYISAKGSVFITANEGLYNDLRSTRSEIHDINAMLKDEFMEGYIE